jgi:hypothetical protein
MSRDARNSLIASGTVLAMCGFFWVQARYHLIPDLPRLPPWTDWVAPTVSAMVIIWEIARNIRAERRKNMAG